LEDGQTHLEGRFALCCFLSWHFRGWSEKDLFVWQNTVNVPPQWWDAVTLRGHGGDARPGTVILYSVLVLRNWVSVDFEATKRWGALNPSHGTSSTMCAGNCRPQLLVCECGVLETSKAILATVSIFWACCGSGIVFFFMDTVVIVTNGKAMESASCMVTTLGNHSHGRGGNIEILHGFWSKTEDWIHECIYMVDVMWNSSCGR